MYLIITSYLLLLLFYGCGLAAILKDFLRGSKEGNGAIIKKPYRKGSAKRTHV